MTGEDTTITTTAELNAALERLLVRATENGVDVTGGWECRTEQDRTDWDVVVTELAAADGAD
jgi:hypothetical protein